MLEAARTPSLNIAERPEGTSGGQGTVGVLIGCPPRSRDGLVQRLAGGVQGGLGLVLVQHADFSCQRDDLGRVFTGGPFGLGCLGIGLACLRLDAFPGRTEHRKLGIDCFDPDSLGLNLGSQGRPLRVNVLACTSKASACLLVNRACSIVSAASIGPSRRARSRIALSSARIEETLDSKAEIWPVRAWACCSSCSR